MNTKTMNAIKTDKAKAIACEMCMVNILSDVMLDKLKGNSRSYYLIGLECFDT